jgi:hypothetical protein
LILHFVNVGCLQTSVKILLPSKNNTWLSRKFNSLKHLASNHMANFAFLGICQQYHACLYPIGVTA